MTDSEIRLGVYYASTQAASSFAKAAGINASLGDSQAQWNALAAWLNRTGGIAGRKVSLVPYSYDLTRSSAQNAQAECAAWTEDNRVYAAYSSMYQGSGAVPCLAHKGVISAQQGFDVGGRADFGQYAPFYYAPASVEMTTQARQYVRGLHEHAFFSRGARVGVVYFDFPAYRAAVRDGVEPTLRAVGQNLADSYAISYGGNPAELGSITSAVANAQLRFAADGITHVLFLDSGGTLADNFMKDADQQHTTYRYGLNSTTFPAFLEQQSGIATQLQQSVVVGTMPTSDTNDLRTAPPNPARTQCLAVFEAAGITPVSPSDAMWMLGMCSFVLFVREALARATSYDVQGFAAAVRSLGRTGATAAAGVSDDLFAVGRPWGAASRGYLTFRSICSCFRYQPSVTRFS